MVTAGAQHLVFKAGSRQGAVVVIMVGPKHEVLGYSDVLVALM